MSTSIKFYEWLAKITNYVNKAVDFIDKSRQEIREELEKLAREWEDTLGLYTVVLDAQELALVLATFDAGMKCRQNALSEDQRAILRAIRAKLVRPSGDGSDAKEEKPETYST